MKAHEFFLNVVYKSAIDLNKDSQTCVKFSISGLIEFGNKLGCGEWKTKEIITILCDLGYLTVCGFWKSDFQLTDTGVSFCKLT